MGVSLQPRTTRDMLSGAVFIQFLTGGSVRRVPYNQFGTKLDFIDSGIARAVQQVLHLPDGGTSDHFFR